MSGVDGRQRVRCRAGNQHGSTTSPGPSRFRNSFESRQLYSLPRHPVWTCDARLSLRSCGGLYLTFAENGASSSLPMYLNKKKGPRDELPQVDSRCLPTTPRRGSAYLLVFPVRPVLDRPLSAAPVIQGRSPAPFLSDVVTSWVTESISETCSPLVW